MLDRRAFLGLATTAGVPLILADQLWADVVPAEADESIAAEALRAITVEQIAAAEAVLGLTYGDSERALMLTTVSEDPWKLSIGAGLESQPTTGAGREAGPSSAARAKAPRARA